MSSREAILKIVASATAPLPSGKERPRAYPRPTLGADLVSTFEARAKRMLCDVACVNDSNDVPSIVADYFSRHKLPARAVIGPTLSNLSWQAAGLDAQVRPVRDTDEAGVTPVFCAIAETATLMLLSRPETPASLSLLPETHVAIVEKRQLVGTMEDAWQKLRAEHGVLPRAVNFVSGPSRTADIEQTVTLGAHGPYRVLIVLVGA